VNVVIPDLHHYERIRQLHVATALVASIQRPTLVLGSSQDVSILKGDASQKVALARRRGGGGAVLLLPGDVWIDWWIPVHDARYCTDLAEQARLAGHWWATALSELTGDHFEIYDGPLTRNETLASACFAGLGRGEVVKDGQKVVGVTQWRVREGAFISTLLPRGSSEELLDLLAVRSEELAEAMHHGSMSSLNLIESREQLEERLLELSGPWIREEISMAFGEPTS
jgi:lipoate-protein ligase A